PVGALRWKPPAPPAPWTGVRKASEFGAACVQPTGRPPNVYTDDPALVSEDCLYLNVWKPQVVNTGTTGAPVMFWIHGGALTSGTPASPLFDGAQLAQRGVVVVSVHYRLGILGFLAHPELSEESAAHVSGNYGLLDQIAALQWVKANIAAFGGDPSNVTIYSQSAGAWNAHLLMASPLAKGLFHKALLGSGGMFPGI